MENQADRDNANAGSGDEPEQDGTNAPANPAGRKRQDALISTLAATPVSGSLDTYSSYQDLTADLPPPELIAGRYRVKNRIGAGGFGVVYKATDERLQKSVAIKVLGTNRAKNANALERFRAEALTAGRIHHPGIVGVTDFERLDDGRPYLVMELVSGETLADLLKRERRVTVSRACRFARLLCQALDAAHKEGIIHRDLKPANVIVREDSLSTDPTVLKILDFGIAKLVESRHQDSMTQSGQVLGTPAYIAPEQIRESATIDGRADLYAVGVILYELLTGEWPYATRDVANMLVSKVVDDPDPPSKYVPDLPPALVKLVMRAIHRDPQTRPQTCDEFATALEPFITLAGGATAQLTKQPTAARPRRVVAAVAAVAFVLAAAVAIVWLVTRERQQPVAASPAPPSVAPAAAVDATVAEPEAEPVITAPLVDAGVPIAPAVAPPPSKKPPKRPRPPPADLPDSPLAPRRR